LGEFDDYEKNVGKIANIFLLLLDTELNTLEKEHKLGTPYWRRQRGRKRTIQALLELAARLQEGKDFKCIVKELCDGFFRGENPLRGDSMYPGENYNPTRGLQKRKCPHCGRPVSFYDRQTWIDHLENCALKKKVRERPLC